MKSLLQSEIPMLGTLQEVKKQSQQKNKDWKMYHVFSSLNLLFC